MENFDIVFVATPITWQQERHDIKPAVNLLYLASFLNAKGYKSKIIDIPAINISLQDAVKTVLAEKTPKIAIPLYQGTFDTALALCDEIKKHSPGTEIIVGGPLFTALPEKILSFESIDTGVIGEGEETLLEIMQKGSEHYSQIDGMAYKINGEIKVNTRQNYIQNLDELPYIDYSLIDMEPYFDLQKELNVPKSIFMTTSRGCAFRCTYCASPFLWPCDTRRYSVARVIDEIKYQSNVFPDINIGFLDDSFFADKKWLEEFFARIPETSVTYSCIGRADHITEQYASLLKQTGCNFVSIGIETGSPQWQKKLKKHLNLDKVRQTVSYLYAQKIYTRGFFMLGFPGETPEDMAMSINFASELKKLGMTDCTFFITILYAGTEMSRDFGHDLWKSQIYITPDSESDFSEEKLKRYSSVPSVDINEYVSHKGLIEIAKTAYEIINKGEIIEAGVIRDIAARFR